MQVFWTGWRRWGLAMLVSGCAAEGLAQQAGEDIAARLLASAPSPEARAALEAALKDGRLPATGGLPVSASAVSPRPKLTAPPTNVFVQATEPLDAVPRSYSGPVEIVEASRGRFILGLQDSSTVKRQDTLLEIAVGTLGKGSPAPRARTLIGPLAPKDFSALPSNKGMLSFKQEVSENQSVHSETVLSQDGFPVLVQISEGARQPYKRALDNLGLSIQQLATTTSGDQPRLEIRYRDQTLTLERGQTGQFTDQRGRLDVQVLRNYARPPSTMETAREGDDYFVSFVIKRAGL